MWVRVSTCAGHNTLLFNNNTLLFDNPTFNPVRDIQMVLSGGGFCLIYSHGTDTQQPFAASPGSPIARSNLTQAIEAVIDPFTQKIHIDRATMSDLGRETQTLRVSLRGGW